MEAVDFLSEKHYIGTNGTRGTEARNRRDSRPRAHAARKAPRLVGRARRAAVADGVDSEADSGGDEMQVTDAGRGPGNSDGASLPAKRIQGHVLFKTAGRIGSVPAGGA